MSNNSQLVFIDDSGDPGFKGATSTNFIMASAVFIEPKAATEANRRTLKDYAPERCLYKN